MKNQNKAYFFAISAILFWSTIASAFKLTLKYIGYPELLFLASLFSTIILLTILILQGKTIELTRVKTNDIFRSALLGLLNPCLYYLILLKAYSLLKAQEAGTLNYIWPITLVLLSVPLLKQKIGFLSVLAVVISFFGIIVISTEGHIGTLEFREPLGVALAVGSSIFWALYWIFNVKDRRDEVLKLFFNFVFGTIYTLFAVFLISGFEPIHLFGFLGSLYIGLFEMGITYYLWLNALKYSENTAKVSNLVYLSPFLSLLIIRQMIGESILFSTVIGLAVIVAGIILQQYASRFKKH